MTRFWAWPILLSSFVFVSGCSESTGPADSRGSTGPIGPVPVPGASDAVPVATLPTLPVDPGELSRAEELLQSTIAKARTTSRIKSMEIRLEKMATQQAGNRHLQDRFLPLQTHRRRMSGGAGISGKALNSGIVAAEQQLIEKAQSLEVESEVLQFQFEIVLQEETWKLLNAKEQALIAKHELIPAEIRDSIMSVPVPSEATRLLPPDWKRISIEGTKYEAAFPDEVSRATKSGIVTYSHYDPEYLWRLSWHSGHRVPDLLVDNILDGEAARFMQRVIVEGHDILWLKSVMLAGASAREVRSRVAMNDRTRIVTFRVGIMDHELVFMEQELPEGSNEATLHMFFDSLRRRSADQ